MKITLSLLSVKALFGVLTMTFLFNEAVAQTNPITAINITLPANPDANVANWGSGVSTFIITATAQSATGRIDPRIEESRILVIIKKDGSKTYGKYTANTAPAASFSTTTKVWSGRNASALLAGEGTLPAGDYQLSVQFFGNSNGKTIALSDEKVKSFTIKENEQQGYQVPQLSVPANNTILTEENIKNPVTFRWTPVIPRPQEPTTYRLRIWQLMEGQTRVQAIRVNQPIITKDVDNITQAVVSNLITGPCKPPYLCDFVWGVQALNRDGKPIGGNNGTSELFSFKRADNGTPAKTTDSGTPQGNQLKTTRVVDAGSTPADNALRTNKPFFEKDSLNAFVKNREVGYQNFTLADGLSISNFKAAARTGARYSGEIIHVGDALFLQINNRYFLDGGQISYSIKNITSNTVSPIYKIDLIKGDQPSTVVFPLQNAVLKKGDAGTVTINISKKYYYIRFKRN